MVLRLALLCLIAISILPTPLGPSAQMSWTGSAIGAGEAGSPAERLHDARSGDRYATTKTQRPSAFASAERPSGTDWLSGGGNDAAVGDTVFEPTPRPSGQVTAGDLPVTTPAVARPGARAPPHAA